MTKDLRFKIVLWGGIVWLFGYTFGILLFPIIPNSLLGWVIMPFGIAAAIWVIVEKVKAKRFRDYVWVGIIWALTAIVLDYFLVVKLFKPVGGYYKLDVAVYYLLTLVLPILVGRKIINEN